MWILKQYKQSYSYCHNEYLIRYRICMKCMLYGAILDCVLDQKPSCTVHHACKWTETHSYAQSLSHSPTLIKQLPPQPQSWGCSRESATLVWTGLFLAGRDSERALVLFQSYWLCLKNHNYLVPFEYAESFSSSIHPPHGWTKCGRIYEGSLQLTETFLVATDKPGFCLFCNITSMC